ncbi:MAG: FG-GAP repeat domain-containing protein [Candidatus Midichloria sp.]
MAVGDFNKDGKIDIVSGNAQSKNISILLGNGDGTFQSAVSYGIGYGARGLVIADFNGDGRPDVATANHELTLYQYY